MITKRYKKIGALAGMGYPLLQMTAQGLIQVGGAEPPFSAPASEILAFFQARNLSLFAIGEYLSTISLILLVWFFGTLWGELREAEGSPGWMSLVTFGLGLLVAGSLTVGGWTLAVFRVNEGLDPDMARMLFDEGNLNFANSWILIGGAVLFAGFIFQGAQDFPKWLGWFSILLAGGLFAARSIWTSPLAFAPYVLFWVWLITLAVILRRRT